MSGVLKSWKYSRDIDLRLSSRCVGWNTSLSQILSHRFSSWILAPFQFHMMYSLLSPPSSCRISRSPRKTLRCSSRARQPKCIVLFNQTVRRRASGEWSPSCFSLQNFSSSSFVRFSALFGRPPLPDSLSCFRFDSNASREVSKILSWIML